MFTSWSTVYGTTVTKRCRNSFGLRLTSVTTLDIAVKWSHHCDCCQTYIVLTAFSWTPNLRSLLFHLSPISSRNGLPIRDRKLLSCYPPCKPISVHLSMARQKQTFSLWKLNIKDLHMIINKYVIMYYLYLYSKWLPIQ